MGLLLLGEKRTQDAHSEWPSSCKLKEVHIYSQCKSLWLPNISDLSFYQLNEITISGQASKVGKTLMSTVKCFVCEKAL